MASGTTKVAESDVRKTVEYGAPYSSATINSVVEKTFGHGFLLSGFEILSQKTAGTSYSLKFGPGSFVSNGVIVEITSDTSVSLASISTTTSSSVLAVPCIPAI